MTRYFVAAVGYLLLSSWAYASPAGPGDAPSPGPAVRIPRPVAATPFLLSGSSDVGLQLHRTPPHFRSMSDIKVVRKEDAPQGDETVKPALRVVKGDIGASEGEGAHPTVGTNVARSLAFDVGQSGYDPAIAVGEKALLVITDHWISYYGRDGKPLPSKSGESTAMSATDFFKIFWEPTLPDNSPNPNNINKYLNFPSDALKVDTTKAPFGQKGAIEEWYDSRCAYDPAHKRFFFLSAARNHLWFNDTATNPNGKYDDFVRRLFAFAVSKTDDPRDGWYYWMTTSTNYADWPRMAVSNGTMMVAHNSPQSGKPFAYVFDESDLVAGHSNPGYFTYYAADFPQAAKVLPVSNYGPSDGMNYFAGVTKPHWNPVLVFGYAKPSSFKAAAPLKSGSASLGTPLDFQIDNPKLRNGKLYFASNLQVVSDRMHVRIVRIPIKVASKSITLTTSGGGYLDHFFGKNGPGDAPTDLVTYVKPAVAINKHDNCAIVYGRVGVTTKKPLYPEARFSLLYAKDTAPRPSVLIHEGDFNPGVGMYDRLDLVNATIDPKDDTTLWLCHAHADKSVNGYTMVVTSVKP
jgi:hypothetical protein